MPTRHQEEREIAVASSVALEVKPLYPQDASTAESGGLCEESHWAALRYFGSGGWLAEP